jgi:hypothetical protein
MYYSGGCGYFFRAHVKVSLDVSSGYDQTMAWRDRVTVAQRQTEFIFINNLELFFRQFAKQASVQELDRILRVDA